MPTLTSCGAALACLRGMSGTTKPGWMCVWVVVMIYIGPGEDASYEDQREGAEELADAEAVCKALVSNLKNHKDRRDSVHVLSDLCQTLACIVRAQGRLDEARQLCKESQQPLLGESRSPFTGWALIC